MGHLFLGSKQENNEKSMSSSPFIDKIHKHYKTGAKSPSSLNTSENSKSEMAAPNMTTREDERGFVKTENFTVMNPREANFQETVKLVERNPCPNGFQLVDPAKSGSKLSVIAEQVRFLQQQAKAVLEEANLNAELHHIACNFKKVPGKIYYVYRREESGAKYMSMISPEEWGENCPDFDAAYKLENDMTFTPYERIEKRANEEQIIDKILKINSNQLSIGFM